MKSHFSKAAIVAKGSLCQGVKVSRNRNTTAPTIFARPTVTKTRWMMQPECGTTLHTAVLSHIE